MSRTDWREIAEQQAAALTAASDEIVALEADISESAEVMDRWAQEARGASDRARAAEHRLRTAESLRNGLVA